MADDIRHFTITTPAGTPLATPLDTAISFPARVVRQVDWRVPNGAMGTMGFVVCMSGVPVLPVFGQFAWVIANDESGSWYPSNYPDSGGWDVKSYNLGANPHAVYLTFHLDLPSPADPGPTVLDVTSLYPVADLSKAGAPVARRP